MLRFFAVPALDPAAAEAELNAFCQAHRVVQIDRQFVVDGARSYWALCVAAAPGPGPLPAAMKKPARESAGDKVVDYKQLLSADEFARFAALRQWRKAAAEQDGVPLYAVLTNEQMATIARRRCSTVEELAAIDGLGGARLRKYGEALLRQLDLLPPGAEGDDGAAAVGARP
jgi:superfamily II DNA helicase RecQ